MRGLDPLDAALTGGGWLASLGSSPEAVWARLVAGGCGIVAVEGEDAPAGLRLVAPVARPWQRAPVAPEQESQVKFLNAAGELAASVAHQALTAAGMTDERVPPERRGLFVAQTDFSRVACLDFRAAVVDGTHGLSQPHIDAPLMNASALSKVNPFILLETLHNNAVSFLTAAFGLRGGNSSLAGYEGTGLAAAALAARAVRAGRVDAAVAVGTGHTTPGVLRHELSLLGAITRASGPTGAARPFDAARDGLVPGDGAGALVLEPLAVARERATGPHVIVVGSGSATGATPEGSLGPDAETLAAAMRAALRDAGVRVGELGGVVAPASGRVREDRHVLEALRDVLAGAAVPVTSAMGALGHAAAGSDAAHLLLAAMALREGVLPTTTGFAQAEPGFEGLAVTRAATPLAGAVVLVLAAGFDGQAHALVLARAR